MVILLMLVMARGVSSTRVVDKLPLTGPSEATQAQTESGGTQTQSQAGLQAQQSMAMAAWAAASISFLALCGLFATVFYARKAWIAARDSAAADNEALSLTRIQLEEAREGAQLQSSRMEQQVSAMKISAKAAQRHATIAQDVAGRQSRCYIEPTGAVFIKPDEKTATLLTNFARIELRCINHGKSIGREIVCHYEFEVIDLDAKSGNMMWAEFKRDFSSKHRSVAPESTFAISLDSEVVKKVESLPTDFMHMGVIRGAVYYKDVFDNEFRSGFVLTTIIPIYATKENSVPIGMSQVDESIPVFEPV